MTHQRKNVHTIPTFKPDQTYRNTQYQHICFERRRIAICWIIAALRTETTIGGLSFLVPGFVHVNHCFLAESWTLCCSYIFFFFIALPSGPRGGMEQTQSNTPIVEWWKDWQYYMVVQYIVSLDTQAIGSPFLQTYCGHCILEAYPSHHPITALRPSPSSHCANPPEASR